MELFVSDLTTLCALQQVHFASAEALLICASRLFGMLHLAGIEIRQNDLLPRLFEFQSLQRRLGFESRRALPAGMSIHACGLVNRSGRIARRLENAVEVADAHEGRVMFLRLIIEDISLALELLANIHGLSHVSSEAPQVLREARDVAILLEEASHRDLPYLGLRKVSLWQQLTVEVHLTQEATGERALNGILTH